MMKCYYCEREFSGNVCLDVVDVLVDVVESILD